MATPPKTIEEAIKENNAKLLKTIGDVVKTTVGSLKRELKGSAAARMSENKKLKYGDTYRFKRKANEDQFRHNQQVLEFMEDAKVATTTDNKPKAEEVLTSGIDFINSRQKLVLLADKSASGWRTAMEYKRNDLAEDDEDEKRMWRAEARAAKRPNARGRGKPFRGGYSNRSASLGASATQQDDRRPARETQRRPGSCYSCGAFGHWKAECTAKAMGQSGQQLSKKFIDGYVKIDQNSDMSFGTGKLEAPDPGVSQNGNIVLGLNQNHHEEKCTLVHIGQVLPTCSGSSTGIPFGNNVSLDETYGNNVSVEDSLYRNIVSTGEVTENLVSFEECEGNVNKQNSDAMGLKGVYKETESQELAVYNSESLGRYDGDDLEDVENIVFKGRLAKSLPFWQSFTTDPVVLDIVENGYKLPMRETPESKLMKNNSSALIENEFVEESILNLLKVDSIEELVSPATLTSPLTVSTNKEGKKRLILDLRYFNLHLFKRKFKCEDLNVAKHFLNKDDFMFKFDLKSGYHHVEIFPPHRQYLGFSWTFRGGSVRYFQFTVLAFGLSTAPFCFTKQLRPLVCKWRGEGKKTLIFIDDGLAVASSLEEAEQASAEMKSDLIESGFVPHPIKSEWSPVQRITWLGCIIDLVQFKFFIPEVRISGLKGVISETVGKEWVPVKVLATIAGQLISMQIAVGNLVRLMTRNLYRAIESSTSWFAKVSVDETVTWELTFWLENIDRLNRKEPRQGKMEFCQVVYSDASGQAYGGQLLSKDSNIKLVRGNFSESEKCKSSTWRELKAVLEVLLGLFNVTNCHLRWYTDNQNVSRIVYIGSTVLELQDLAVEIFNVCKIRNIQLHVEWVPRAQNTEADLLSKQVDFDDWFVADWVFRWIESLWGPHTVDRFGGHTL